MKNTMYLTVALGLLSFFGLVSCSDLSSTSTGSHDMLMGGSSGSIAPVEVSKSVGSSPAPLVPAVSNSGLSRIKEQFFQAVNQYRSENGKSALVSHAGLDRLAQQHSTYLLNNRGKFGIYGKDVSHYGFEGRATLAKELYKMQVCSENVVSGSGSVASLVSSLKNSENHDFNMKNKWDVTGVGVAVASDGQILITQLFATAPSQSHYLLKEKFR